MAGVTAPVKTLPQACAAAARSALLCSRMQKHAKVSLLVHKIILLGEEQSVERPI